MSTDSKDTLKIVKPDAEDAVELEEKIREHRRKIRKWTLIIVLICAAVFIFLYLFMKYRTYTDYTVLSTQERQDTAATEFESFHGNILKYSNDGASYIDLSNHLIWNQTYEMQQPQVDICGTFAVIYDKRGTQIYIMDTSGLQGTMEANLPIEQVHVGNQGTIAVLMEDGSTSHIQLYDKKGKALAEGEIHIENSGYPVDLAISDDSIKLAVAMLDVNEGKVKTTIAFYNFGSVGQNEIDNIVCSYSYSDLVIPRIEFVTNDRMVAFGDSQMLIFEGTQKPEETAKVALQSTVKSIFYNDEYIGIVTENAAAGQVVANTQTESANTSASETEAENVSDDTDTEKENGAYQMKIYDGKGKETLTRNFDLDYSTIEFLDNNDICILNSNECELFTSSGVKRFQKQFKDGIYKVLSGSTSRAYTFIVPGETQRVKLK